MADDALPNGADNQPQVGMVAQYLKDLSFENPNAPAVYQFQEQPRIDVQFNIQSNKVGDEVYEVVLKIDLKADSAGRTAYQVELAYAGLFSIRNLPDEHLQPFLLAEAPRLLFPFARRILADSVRDGAFPPMLLDPVDFGAFYQQQAVTQQGADGQSIGNA